MTFYVHRERIEQDNCMVTRFGQREVHDLRQCSHYVLQDGWTGPIRSQRQAERERAAWMNLDTGEWTAEVLPSSPEVRAKVQEWQRRTDRRHGRR